MLDYGFWAWDEDDCSHSFVECRTDFRSATYFCINFPPCVINRISAMAESQTHQFRQPFLLEVVITSEVMRICRRAVTCRNCKLIRIVSLAHHILAAREYLGQSAMS